VALNKVDLPDGKAMADMVEPILRERGYEVYQISAAARIGLDPLLYAMGRLVNEYRAKQSLEEKARIVLRPTPVDGYIKQTLEMLRRSVIWQIV
jgi:GTP-binding protein